MATRERVPMLTVTICVGSACCIRGSDELASAIENLLKKEQLEESVELVGAFCMDTCSSSSGVSVRVGDELFTNIDVGEAEGFFYGHLLPRIHREAERS